MEEKLVLVKKYGVIGALAVAFPFVEPYITKYFSDMTVKKFSGIVKEEIYRCSAMENKLTDETLLAVCRYSVGKQSIHKVSAIKRILLKAKLDTDYSKNRTKLAIRNALIKHSNVYIEFLNTLAPHPNLGYIGDYIQKNFNMEEFLSSVNAIAMMEDCGVDSRTEDIMQYMLLVQEQFFDDMYKSMKRR